MLYTVYCIGKIWASCLPFTLLELKLLVDPADLAIWCPNLCIKTNNLQIGCKVIPKNCN